jgi:UDP-N-acetylglucosamine--N-acetylmuramyl-(pentapeptide) pyrophosphoryl-undecaprenol N-acetylglucosamine transferase
MKNILFTGGGSAGHVVPNLALIEELLSAGKVSVSYIGTGGIEKQIVAEWKLPYYQIECPKLIRGGGAEGLKRNLKIPVEFYRAVKAAKEALDDAYKNGTPEYDAIGAYYEGYKNELRKYIGWLGSAGKAD